MAEHQFAQERELYGAYLREGFNQSGFFLKQTRRAAQDVVERPEFEAIVRESLAGTLDAARRIGEMAVVYLDSVPEKPGAWWRDLVNYERAIFLQIATTEPRSPANRPRRGTSAMCARFGWALPELLQRLASGETIAEDLHRNVTLLFSRTEEGKINVTEIGAVAEKVFRMTNGLRTVEQIASASDVSLQETQETLALLSQHGAIVLGKSADEMMRILREQGRA